MSDSENIKPMGKMARKYILPVMGTFFLESKTVVKRARSWVMRVAKAKCQVVRTMGKRKPAVSRIHLLKMMTPEESEIQVAM
jgi:hypothetical protein